MPSGVRKKPPEGTEEQILQFAKDGYSQKSIAKALGVGHDLFITWLDQYPELKEAFEQGRESERMALHNKLYRLAMDKDDKIAAMFLLKARHGYREGDQADTANKVSITFNLPGALSMDQFQKVIIPESSK